MTLVGIEEIDDMKGHWGHLTIWQFKKLKILKISRFWRYWWSDDMDDIIVVTHWWRNTWGATKEASVVGRLSSCCLGINIISFLYLFCCFCFSVSESWPTKAQVHVTGGFCSYITMTIICLFSAASLSRSFSLMRKIWPKKALVRVIGEGFCYYITMTTIYFFSVASFSFVRKNWPKKCWSGWLGRDFVTI